MHACCNDIGDRRGGRTVPKLSDRYTCLAGVNVPMGGVCHVEPRYQGVKSLLFIYIYIFNSNIKRMIDFIRKLY